MKCALLFVLLLLLLRLVPWGETQSTAPAPTTDAWPLRETNGFTCAKWLYGTEPPQVEVFQCAGQPDGAEVKFCCGTCNQTRSCSFEELSEGSPARPTDGEPEPCPPMPHWLLVTFFCGGVIATVIFYWVFYRACRRFWRTKTVTFEIPEGIEGEISSSVRPRGSDTYTRLDPPLPVGTLGPPSLHDDRPASTSSNAPSVQPQARMSGNVAVVWFSTGLVPIRMETSPPQLNRGGRRSLTGPEN